MATRDRHGAAWMSTCHSDCCSRQGQQDILSTVYRDEKQLTNVSTCTVYRFELFLCKRLWLFISVSQGKLDIFTVQVRKA